MTRVTDEEVRDNFQATKRETNLLLRAWLSPLPPPPVEKLVDLT